MATFLKDMIEPLYDTVLAVKKTSVCECGYTFIDRPVGTRYRAISSSKSSGRLICGGCKKLMPVTLILCEQSTSIFPASLILEIMEVVPD